MMYYLTMPEFSALLRISRVTLRKLLNNGTIPHLKVGREVRIHIDALKIFEVDPEQDRIAREKLYGERIRKMHAVQPNMQKRRARLAASAEGEGDAD